MKQKIPAEFYLYLPQIIFLLIATIVSYLIGEYFDPYGKDPTTGKGSKELEFTLNMLFALLLAIWWFSAVTYDRLRTASLIFPIDKNNKANIDLVNNLGTLLALSLEHYTDFQQRLIRKAITNQLENLRLGLTPERGYVRFYVESIEDPEIQQLFHLGIENRDKILATCFSEMDDFWYVPRVGSAYAHINWKLINQENVDMLRLIFVNDHDWPKKEVKKRELIRVLRKMGCECRIITERAIDSAGISKEDMFIVRSKKSNSIAMGFKWELSSTGDTSSILLLFQNKQLEELQTVFAEMLQLSEPVPARLSELEIPPTEAAAKDYIEKLSRDYLPTNTVQYLRDPARDYEAVANYWSGLRKTIIRPMASSVDWIDKMMKQQFTSKERHQYKVGILGGTPELRVLAAQHFPESVIDIFDLSEVMARSMELVAEKEYPEVKLHERFIMQNWLTLYHRPREYDLIMGIDVLNMVNRADMRLLTEIVSDLLLDDGVFLTQVITMPEDSYYKDLLKLSFDEGYLKFAEMVTNGQITEEEMFVKLCFWSLSMKDFTINIGNLVERIEDLEKKIPSQKRFGISLSSRYEQCNTTLSLLTKTEFIDMFEDYFYSVSRPFYPTEGVRKENIFPKYMLTYKLQKPKMK